MKTLTVILGGALVAGCVASQSASGGGVDSEAILKAGFSQGNPILAARVSIQDDVQAECSKFRDKPPKGIAAKIQKEQLATIKFPEKLMGDWKIGEKIAQSGWGLRHSDMDMKGVLQKNAQLPDGGNGGNCYACHQLDPQELSYGTLGPSLYRYGAVRGNTAAIQKYTWGKIANSQAYNACSTMPRFAHNGILTEEQIKHVTALLLDPNSPVNK